MSSETGGGSRPSKTNRPGHAEGGEPPESATPPSHASIEPGDIPGGLGLRPISTEADQTLRAEAAEELTDGVRARATYRVVNEWRDWYRDYLNSHIEYEDPNGETVRSGLKNSYMPEYGNTYYAKLKGLEREAERRYEDMTTVMLTDTASHRTVNGEPRAVADHMREIADGFDVQRKALHRVLEGYRWEYVKVWEPHKDGFGHLHIAIFVEDPDNEIEALDFRSVMRSYYENTQSAGWDAHRNSPCEDHAEEGVSPWNAAESSCEDCNTPVSVSHDVHDLGCYISEYIGVFGESPLERDLSVQTFYAAAWATNTRRVEFSNGAQELCDYDQFRRETGLRPEDRGGECVESWKDGEGDSADESGVEIEVDPDEETVTVSGGSSGWSVDSIVQADEEGPEYHDPTTGGVETVEIDGAMTDPPPDL